MAKVQKMMPARWWLDADVARFLDLFFSLVYQGRIAGEKVIKFAALLFSLVDKGKIQMAHLLNLERAVREHEMNATEAGSELLQEIDDVMEGRACA